MMKRTQNTVNQSIPFAAKVRNSQKILLNLLTPSDFVPQRKKKYFRGSFQLRIVNLKNITHLKT